MIRKKKEEKREKNKKVTRNFRLSTLEKVRLSKDRKRKKKQRKKFSDEKYFAIQFNPGQAC